MQKGKFSVSREAFKSQFAPAVCKMIIALLALLPGARGVAQELAWVRQMGGTNIDYGVSVAVDSDGNAYVVGTFAYRATFGTILLEGKSLTTGYVAKITPQGEVKWAHAFGGTNGIQLGGMAVDPAGFVYVAGSFHNEAGFGTNHLVAMGNPTPYELMTDIFLAKYSLDGALVWAKRYGGTDVERDFGLFVDQHGNVFLSGTYRSFSVLGKISLSETGREHVWVAKLSSDGEVQWASSAGSEIWLYAAPQVTGDPQGNIYVAGGFLRSINFPMAASTNGTANIRLEGLAGDRSTMFLAKYDSTGACLWARSGGGPASDLDADAEGNVYVTGTLQASYGHPYSGVFDNIEIVGNNDCYLARFDASGGLVWVENEGGSAIVLGRNADIYATGQLQIARTFGGRTLNALGYLDIFVGRYDKTGKPISAWQVGDLETENASGLAVDSFGNIYVAGGTYHSSNLNYYGLTNYGSHDALVARLAQAGPLITSQPQRLTLYRGSNAVFSVEVTNAAAARFLWHRNGTPLVDDSRISGSTTETLVINAADVPDEADYNVRITADNGQIFSSTARLRIEGLMKFIKTEKSSYGAFLVTFSGSPGHLYDVEVSSNFLNWSFLTNGFCIQDTMTVSDYGFTNSDKRFYRAVTH